MKEHKNANFGSVHSMLLLLGISVLIGVALIISSYGDAEAGHPDRSIALHTEPEDASAGTETGDIGPRIQASASLTTYLPSVFGADLCAPIPNETYASISVSSDPTDRPADEHADLNLALRSYVQTSAYLGLVDLPGATDSNAPQLPSLFGDNRTGVFQTVHQVHDWTWATNSRGAPITDPPGNARRSWRNARGDHPRAVFRI